MPFRELKPVEWQNEIDDGLDYRRKFGIESTWAEIEAMYYNVHPSMANDGPNILMSIGDSLLSTLNVPRPRYIVKPERREAVSKVRLVESVDNVLLRELDIADAVDTATLHAFLFGTGFTKMGYDSEYGFDPSLDLGGFLQLGLTLTQYDKKGERRLETDSGVAPGMPWVKAVAPHDIVVPWGTISIESCPWVAHRFVRHIDDLKADRKYSNTQRLSPTLSMEDFVESYKSTIRVARSGVAHSPTGRPYTRRGMTSETSRDVAYVELYEIHDRRTGRIYAIAPGHPGFLRNDINALQIENRLPFAEIVFTPRSRSLWSTSDAYYLRHLQIELSDLAVQRTKIRRLSVLKFLYDRDVINDEQLAKLTSPDVGAAASIEAGQDLNKAVIKMETHPDQTLILEEEHLRRNSREQVGFSRNQLGEFTGGRRTATEAKIVDTASALRMSRRGKAIGRLYEKIIETVNGIIFNHWTTPRWIQVVGESEAEEWEQITGPALKSRYSYEVIFTDDQELRQRRMEALQLYTYLVQDPSIDPVALRQYISDQYNDPEFARLWNADIQDAMRVMRIGAGMGGLPGPPGRGGQRQASGLPQLQSSNGQGGLGNLSFNLAQGGTSAGAR